MKTTSTFAGVALAALLTACSDTKNIQVTPSENNSPDDVPTTPVVQTPTTDVNQDLDQTPSNDNTSVDADPIYIPEYAYTGNTQTIDDVIYNVIDGSALEEGQHYQAAGNTHIINEVPDNTRIDVDGVLSWDEQNGHGKTFTATEGICFTNLGGSNNLVEAINDGASILGNNVSGAQHSLEINGDSGIIQASGTFSAHDTTVNANGAFQNVRFENFDPEANGNVIDTHRFTSGNNGLGVNTSFTDLEHLTVLNGNISSSAQFWFTEKDAHTLNITTSDNYVEFHLNGRTYLTGRDICDEHGLICDSGKKGDKKTAYAPAATARSNSLKLGM